MGQKILLLEDEENLNRGISLKLEKEGYKVYAAKTVWEAILIFKQQKIDLIICDVGLPDGNGFDFCKKVRRESNVFFLFLTALDSEIDMINGYEAGADDYISKPFSLSILVSKVNAVMKRIKKSKENKIISGDITFYIEEKQVKKGEEFLILTQNEWKLLDMFLKHPKYILSKKQLLETLWDIEGEYIDENTIAVNIRRLREKIEKDPSNPIYIKNVRGMGYVWEMECIKK